MTKARRSIAAAPADDQAAQPAARLQVVRSRSATKAADGLPKARSPRRTATADAATATPRKARAKASPTDPAAPPKPARTAKPRLAVASGDVKPRAKSLPQLTPDQPIGQAAREIARIRADMQQIRSMIDAPRSDAHLMLQRLCHDPLPQGGQGGQVGQGGTASVIELMPRLRQDAPWQPTVAFSDTPVRLRQAAAMPALPVGSDAAIPDAPALSRPASRVTRLLAAWGDWLMWRLMPPPRPVMSSPARVPLDMAPAPVAEQRIEPPQDPTPPLSDIIARLMDDTTLRDHLQIMIREELEGEMGAKFSANLRAVVRREVASALDDRLTHG